MFEFIKKIIGIFIKPKTDDRGTGLLESPNDFRDIPLSAVSREVIDTPAEYSIPYKLTMKNQGTTSECVAYTCSSIMEYLQRKEGNVIEFDPHWIYQKCKQIDGIPDVKGTYFRAGLKVLKEYGAKPLNGKEEDAQKYRIGGYVRVDCTFSDIKRAIYEHGTIMMGFKGTNEGWGTAMIRAPRLGEKEWGHATTGISYKVTMIDGHNSWGEEWGDKGLFHFTDAYKPFECWAILSVLPSNWKDLLKAEDMKPKYEFKKDLYRGMEDPEIIILQDALKYYGCMDPEIRPSETFGPKTFEAVVLFQKRFGVSPATGRFGPLTRERMNGLLKEKTI